MIPAAFVFLLVWLAPLHATAAPITWTFAGVTDGIGIAEIPVGSPFTVSVVMDPATPNSCPAGSVSGLYSGPGGVLTIQSAVGPLVYTSGHYDLLAGSLEFIGCATTTPPSPGPVAYELRMGDWSGPSFPDAVFDVVRSNAPPRPGLFWFSAAPNFGAYPVTPLLFPYFDGPYVLTPTGRQTIASAVPVRLVSVPTPSPFALLVVAAIGAVVWRKTVSGV